MRPDKPGYYWWRYSRGVEWEPIQVLQNSDGDLWCKWIGKPGVSHISVVGGEWLGQAHPPKRITTYAHYVKAMRVGEYASVDACCRFGKRVDGEWVRREEIKEYRLKGNENG